MRLAKTEPDKIRLDKIKPKAIATAFLILLLQLHALAQPAAKTPGNINNDDIHERIVGAALTRGGAISFLETLTDTIGGRVTGSPESHAASDLILKELRAAGFDNAHFEDFPLEVSWQRGPASAWVSSQTKRPLYIGSYGWSPGTNGRIEAPLVTVVATPDGMFSTDDKKEAVERLDPAKLRGAVVLVTLESAASANTFAANYVVLRSRIARQLAAAGAVAMLIPSEKPDRMLYTSAAGIYPRAPLPMLSVAKEDTLFLRRLLAKGEVKIGLDIQNTFSDYSITRPINERNVIADIPGSDPNAVVLLGAHFDSWDPAQGADDNGTGIAMVLEAARILKSLNVKPKATIRFAFFSGEEQACLGSRAYVDAHKNQLDHLWAALITDNGALMPTGFSLHGRDDLRVPLQRELAGLAPLGAATIVTEGDLYSDDETFVVEGVPALSLEVVPSDYDNRHHTIIDTFDKIDPRSLSLDTAVLALASYEIAASDHPPGRRFSPREVDTLLKKTGQADYVDLDFKRSPQP
ncbi:MAG TPA: M20/M25/M40 family metallo-hydrolase [Terriglobales bacterium]|nr:M20/M25/M40 family metallo-hydrolase [Terriglobales bacterium]